MLQRCLQQLALTTNTTDSSIATSSKPCIAATYSCCSCAHHCKPGCCCSYSLQRLPHSTQAPTCACQMSSRQAPSGTEPHGPGAALRLGLREAGAAAHNQIPAATPHAALGQGHAPAAVWFVGGTAGWGRGQAIGLQQGPGRGSDSRVVTRATVSNM